MLESDNFQIIHESDNLQIIHKILVWVSVYKFVSSGMDLIQFLNKYSF